MGGVEAAGFDHSNDAGAFGIGKGAFGIGTGAFGVSRGYFGLDSQ